MANSNAQTIKGTTLTAATTLHWSFWADWLQVVNTTGVTLWVTTDGASVPAADDSGAVGAEQVPNGAIVLVPNRQIKQPTVSKTAPSSTVQAGYNVWTSANTAASNPTTITIIGESTPTAGDVTVQPR